MMGLFFLATLFTFLVGRAFAAARGRPRHETPWWAPWLAGSILGALLLIVCLDAAWQVAREAGSGSSGIGRGIALLSYLGSAEAAVVLGGILAGALLYEGFRRTPPVPDGDEELAVASEKVWDYVSGARTAAHAVLAAALFLAVALLAQPEILARLRLLDAGGVKIELQTPDSAARSTDLSPRTKVVVGERVETDAFPYLALLNDLIRRAPGQDEPDMITRDRAIIDRLGGVPPARTAEVERLLQSHRDFLRALAPSLGCTTAYVETSGDRRLIAIRGVDVALRLAITERALRAVNEPQAPPSYVARSNADALFRRLSTLTTEMGDYLVAAGMTRTGCQPDWASPDGVPETFPWLDGLWAAGGGQAPYLTLAAAWLGGAYQAPSFATRTLLDWLDGHPLTGRAGEDIPRAWFRVRALIQLVNIMLESQAGTAESPAARLVLERTLVEMGDLPGLPPLASYARGKVEGKEDRCPGAHNQPSNQVDASLYYTRLFLTARLLHAVIDNPNPDRTLNAQHMRLATELRDADLICLPKKGVDEEDRLALDAIHRVTFARTAFAWAAASSAAGLATPSQAADLRTLGRVAFVEGRRDLDELYRQWLDSDTARQQKLADRILKPWIYLPDLERARQMEVETSGRSR